MVAALAAGTTLVVDRYTGSGAAFSMAKGLDEEWCRAPDLGLPRPDLVLFMDVSAAESAERAGYGGERYEREAFQQLAYEAYGRLRDPERWVTVEAARKSPLALACIARGGSFQLVF
jgi:dTMP kinase